MNLNLINAFRRERNPDIKVDIQEFIENFQAVLVTQIDALNKELEEKKLGLHIEMPLTEGQCYHDRVQYSIHLDDTIRKNLEAPYKETLYISRYKLSGPNNDKINIGTFDSKYGAWQQYFSYGEVRQLFIAKAVALMNINNVCSDQASQIENIMKSYFDDDTLPEILFKNFKELRKGFENGADGWSPPSAE